MIVVRTTVNPHLVHLVMAGDKRAIHGFVLRVRKIVVTSAFAVALLLAAAYPVVVEWDFDLSLSESWLPFMILVSGMVVYAALAPFDAILLQTGYSGTHPAFVGLHLGTNVGLKLVLIPTYGILGTAAAMALSFVLAVFYLCQFMDRRLGYTLHR